MMGFAGHTVGARPALAGVGAVQLQTDDTTGIKRLGDSQQIRRSVPMSSVKASQQARVIGSTGASATRNRLRAMKHMVCCLLLSRWISMA
jgi:hypothetical protein